MGPLSLKLILQAVDRASAPVRGVMGVIGQLGGKIGALTGRLARVSAVSAAAVAGVALLAGVRVAKASWSMVKEAADAGDAAWATSQKVGLSVVAYQRWAYAAKLANMESGGLNMALGLLSSNMDSAARGGKEDAKVFAALRIQVRNARGELRPTDEVLAQLADRFAAMPDGPAKTALAMKMFGRSGRDMIPLLNEGSAKIREMGDEAERLGVVLSGDAARAGDEFNDNMDRMRASVAGLKIGIGGALLPTVNQYVVAATKWIAAHRPEIMEKVNLIVSKLAIALADVDWVRFAEGIGKAAVLVIKLFEALGGLDGIITTLGVVGIGQATASVLTFAAAIGVLTGPIGWTILAIGVLAAAVFVLIRNWDKVSAWAVGLWEKIRTAFVSGAAKVWNAIPKWLQFILKGVGFVLKVAANPARTGLEMGAAAGQRVRGGPRAAVGGGRGTSGRVQVDVRVDQDGRVAGVRSTARGSGVVAGRPRGAVRPGR